jgi:hypothetical protein
MAGTLIVSNLTTDTDNTFIVRSNTGTTLFSANTTGIDIANSIGATAITSDKILSIANTKITGNVISSQIAPNLTLNGNLTVSTIKVDQIQTTSGVILANLNSSGANIGFQLASTLAPAFSATRTTTQTVSSSTYTKVLFTTEEFDTNNNFASSTFTPTVAGYYQINAAVGLNSTGESLIQLYKNGALFKTGQDLSTTVYNLAFSALVYANGSSDYFDVYVYPGAGTTVSGSSGVTYFQGFLARSAL